MGMMRRSFLLSFFVAIFAGMTLPVWAKTAATKQAVSASTAEGVITSFYAQLTESMKQGDRIGFAGRYKKLTPVIQASFDFPTMTRMAVGPAWTSATPAEQQQLIAAFADFSVANYANQFKAYDGEKFIVDGTQPTPNGVTVTTHLQPKDGDAVGFDYLMRQDDKGAWRIVDVFINGTISQMAARRSEFSSIAKRDGIDALVNSLGEKTKQMGPS